ncbi:unnamed protein product [Ceutorhynchus assimilis]|uniref:Peroxisomal ATPase PEX1 n=1 Tax=Ceutorhynchus assimilis TaxID=467358 RepID=A0A9N9QJU1_9CUCU|nr:unnamed protein product [Ceutorhynchus assimilis]
MFESVLRVKYVSFKNCFVYLSTSHKHLNTGNCFKITYGENRAYFSASMVRNVVDDESIGINSAYAKLIGIEENTFVNVLQVQQLPVVNSISIQPFTKSDYDVLEMLSQNVQSNLLDQVRVIDSDQKLIIWVGTNMTVPVIVENVKPIAPGILDFLTEVIIKPPNNVAPIKNISDKKKNHVPDNTLLKIFENNSQLEKPLESTDEDLNFYYRLFPMSELPLNIQQGKIWQPFEAFISKNPQISTSEFYNMKLLNSPISDKQLFIKLNFLEDVFGISDHINIFVNDPLINFMQSDYGARVVLKKITKMPYVKEIEVHSRKSYLINIVEKLKIYLAQNSKPPLILNSDFPIEINSNLYCSLKFMPNSIDCCVVDEEFLRNCSYSLHDEFVKPLDSLVKKDYSKMRFCEDISSAKDICDSIFSVYFKHKVFRAENVILCGKVGMGKTSLLNHIATKLKSYPYFINTEMVQCKKIRGKTVDSFHKLFTGILAKLISTQPSVMILDDLQVLCESCEGEETPNSIYYNRASEMLYSLFSSILQHNSIGILASTDSISKLNKQIYRSRGNHLFKNVFNIEDLSKSDRMVLWKYCLEQHNVDETVDYEKLAIKTDGFVVQDIQDCYEKSLFEAYKETRDHSEQIKITQEHCDLALKKSCSLSLQNVKFHLPGTKSFEDIGGLHNVKNTLVESLLWPVKYSSIFANAPLRLQSGILLYGPPGTGKTLLAAAAAQQCSLRLISIKGPELLSKYIGASEQSVRDVFEKAQSAKPCILFFDEFDSLAPRRGHDNTGVTDRVVNQLLTQLDGVEALTGVCVLAATSRPDLLDPALLRPGRLDKQLLCSMPSQGERLEILEILSKNLDFESNVDLKELAIETEGYSGADLQAVLYTAQISTLKEFDYNHDDQKSLPVLSKITQRDLLEALDKSRPSLTKSEREKYDKVYAKFQGGNTDDFQAGSKVTLA